MAPQIGDNSPAILQATLQRCSLTDLRTSARTGAKQGTPQGAVVSPLIANVYLHYVFDLWADVWRRKAVKGDVIIVRYADDLVLGLPATSRCRAVP
jgi:hypothetical protein